MKWYCVCGEENKLENTHCHACKKEKTEKLFPLWQRAMRDAKDDFRKYRGVDDLKKPKKI